MTKKENSILEVISTIHSIHSAPYIEHLLTCLFIQSPTQPTVSKSNRYRSRALVKVPSNKLHFTQHTPSLVTSPVHTVVLRERPGREADLTSEPLHCFAEDCYNTFHWKLSIYFHVVKMNYVYKS